MFFQAKKGQSQQWRVWDISLHNSGGTSPGFHGNSRTTSQAHRQSAHPPASWKVQFNHTVSQTNSNKEMMRNMFFFSTAVILQTSQENLLLDSNNTGVVNVDGHHTITVVQWGVNNPVCLCLRQTTTTFSRLHTNCSLHCRFYSCRFDNLFFSLDLVCFCPAAVLCPFSSPNLPIS